MKYSSAALGAIPIPVNVDQTPFMTKYKDNILVATSTGTSVNHIIAQKRSLTGNGAWNGRTLQEAMAMEYGADFPIPNVNMGTGGYLERGSDDSLAQYAYAEAVADAKLFPLGLDGSKGIKGAPDKELLAMARKLRNEKLDPESVFAQTFAKSDRLKRWYDQRGAPQGRLEAMDLITRLNILPDSPPTIPLADYGLGVVQVDTLALRLGQPARGRADTGPSSTAPAPGYLIQVSDAFGRSISFEYALQPGSAAAVGGRIARAVRERPAAGVNRFAQDHATTDLLR